MSEIFTTLDDPNGVAQILGKLLRKADTDSALLAFQISFDLVHNATQQFLSTVRSRLSETTSNEPQEKQKDEDDMPSLVDETDIKETSPLITKPEPIKKQEHSTSTSDSTGLADEIDRVLSGEVTIEFDVGFLFKNNKTDLQILKVNSFQSFSCSLYY